LVEARAVIAFLGLLAVILLAVADYAVGRDLGLSLFYAVPLFLVARRAGLLAGAGLALAATLAWALAWAFGDARGGASYSVPWVPYWNGVTRLGYFALAVAAARMRSGLELEAERARRDPLTGLLNRRGFLEAARLEVVRTRRYGHSLTLAYLDCDDFKVVNDTRGHAAGDRLLRSVGDLMLGSVRSLDIPARVGGDEFVLLLPETRAPEARETLERFATRLRSELAAQGWPVTFSIGAVTHDRPPLSVEAILESADRVMYRAKQHGKDRLEQEVFDAPEDSEPRAMG
jgi:diguanylate cyclase (GGDEF)-like protein